MVTPRRALHLLFVFAFMAAAAAAQSTATLSGQVLDKTGGSIAEARVTLAHPLTGLVRQTITNSQGEFTISNLPLHTYRLTVEKDGFSVERREVELLSNVPVSLQVELRVAEQAQALEVMAVEGRELLQPEATGTRTEISMASMERLPVAIGSRGLEAVLQTFPGFAVNANGAIHPRGAHNQMTYVVDGMPISDQFTGSFATSLDPSTVQSLELLTGNIPAEFGSKISGVANITTRSGLGTGRRFTGSLESSAAGFDTLAQSVQFAGGGRRFGYSSAFSAMKTHRFLDQVSLDNLNNGGNSERAFTRVDAQLGERDLVRFTAMTGRSAFNVTNLRSQHAAGQDQRQVLRDLSLSTGWVHTLGPTSTFDASASWRTSVAQLFPSAGDTPVTAAQARHLTTITLSGRYNMVRGGHTLRVGGDYQRFPVSENFSFAITDPRFNDPADEAFIPTLLAHDLSRGGSLFHFSEKAAGTLSTVFVQDNLRWNRFTFALGARYDVYRFLVRGHQLQPRLGISFHIRETGTVLRASYNRNYQTPPNENLLLSNSDEAAVLVPGSVRDALGAALIRIAPERQNVYEVGLQQSLGSKLVLNTAYYHKDSRDQQDNDNFFNTGIIFPTSLSRIRVNGAEARLVLQPVHGISGTLSATHYHAVTTPPFTGGLFLGNAAVQLLGSGPFVIDHDQTLGLHGTLQYTTRRGLWSSLSVRHDSGLVSNPSDPAEVAADPDYSDLLPYVNLLSDPPRVRPRTITDVAVGYAFRRDSRTRWDAQVQVSNLTNRTALFNFQSIFVGTRLVQPRTVGVKLRLSW